MAKQESGRATGATRANRLYEGWPPFAFGSFKRARAALGVESFGMQVVDVPPNSAHHPWHHQDLDGQEEVEVVLRGDGEIEIEGAAI